jgi:glycosyltransferase involved in cell wall biosynthesis
VPPDIEPNAPDVSVVIPVYNSARFLADSVESIRKVLGGSTLSYELILVDDASKDDSVATIEKIMAGQTDCTFVPHLHNTGRGRAVMDGMRAARGRCVGFVDADLSTPAHYIPILTSAILDDGADVATGLRVYAISWRIVHRWILSRGYNVLVRYVLRQSFRDSETGCKFFRREKLRPLLDETESQGWFWDTEIMVRSAMRGYRIVEVPTVFIRRPELGSTVRLVSDTIDYARHLWRFRRTVAQLRHEREKAALASSLVGSVESGREQ